MISEFYEFVVLLWNNNGKVVIIVYLMGFVLNKGVFVFFMKNRFKWSKSFCIYYINSIVIFYLLLEGDLVFKLNFGFL